MTLAALATSLCLTLSAAGPVVAEGPNGLKITYDDLNADAQRIPATSRHVALGQPDAVQQASQNIYIRRVLAAEAVRDGLDKDPMIAATLQLARERVLSDARLAKIDDANRPSAEAIEKSALAQYNADPSKFRTTAQARVSHILIAGNTDKAKALAEQVLAQVKAGGDFAAIAREKSADVGSGQKGGDLGWFSPGRMVPEFDDAVATLKKPGDMTGLVQSQFGWHIIRLDARRDGGIRTYDEVKDELRQVVANQLQSDVRLKEATRIAGTMKVDRPAIEAFSALHKK
ncbi:peptidylprolyl isomerase [Caenimonas sedimenti]|uniref:peptidylprolyl isomerase n=2 Tax=Caenimonas sedimenti TaxID=2596921 RepID=A0A562ZWK2_9BURK|nr:peptidylprolyl isomerase [Caenimonas sedimenti]